MKIKKPFKRTIRPFIDGNYNRDEGYIFHKDYANSPEQYIRAYLIIQKDFINLLDYIEPADVNLDHIFIQNK